MVTRSEINELQSVLGKLGNSAPFASDLIRSYNRYGHLTPNQEPWVSKLIARVTSVNNTPAKTTQLADFTGVINLFQTAKLHLKYPKIMLLLGDAPVILSLAGERSKAPGMVNIAGEGQYPDRVWYGRVSPSGAWEPSHSVNDTQLESLSKLLSELAAKPYEVAANYGKLTGHCCFCGLKLSDTRSTGVGYGPVCADHYGLKSHWTNAASFLAA